MFFGTSNVVWASSELQVSAGPFQSVIESSFESTSSMVNNSDYRLSGGIAGLAGSVSLSGVYAPNSTSDVKVTFYNSSKVEIFSSTAWSSGGVYSLTWTSGEMSSAPAYMDIAPYSGEMSPLAPSEITFTIDGVPSAPVGLKATPSDGEVSLSWSTVSKATTYIVLENGITVAQGIASTSYTVKGLTNGTSYSFSVESVNSVGSSVPSSSVSSTPSFTNFAVNTGLSANLSGGSLSLSAPSISTSFPAEVLNGNVTTLSATLSNWTITDATGTGDGWDVQLQASQLTEVPPTNGYASGTSADTLPLGSLSLSGSRSVVAGVGSKPVSSTNGPNIESINTPIDVVSPVKLIKADLGYGLGTYTIKEPSDSLTLTLNPATTRVDSVNYPSQPTPYQTTLTYNVVTGP